MKIDGNNSFQFEKKLNQASHIVGVAGLVGFVRVGYGTIKTAIAMIETVGSALQNKPSKIAKEKIALGFDLIGRGFIEMIPVFGAIFARDIDIREEATELAMNGKIDEAVQKLKEMTSLFIHENVNRVVIKLLQSDQIDDANAFLSKWENHPALDRAFYHTAQRFLEIEDDESVTTAEDLTNKISDQNLAKILRKEIDRLDKILFDKTLKKARLAYSCLTVPIGRVDQDPIRHGNIH